MDDRATAVTASPAASQAAAAPLAPAAAAPVVQGTPAAGAAATAPHTEAPPTSAPARPTEQPDTVRHPGPEYRSPSAVDAARAPGTGETARTTAAGPPAQRHGHRIRKARLRLLRIDAWSVMKTAFLLSIAASATLVVAVGVLWSVLDAAGVFSAVGDVVRDVTSSESNPGFSVEEYLGFSRVIGFSILIAVIDVVLITALATLGAFLYNLSASLLGGLEVTLAEDD